MDRFIDPAQRLRIDAFRRHMLRLGLPFEVEWVFSIVRGFEPEAGRFAAAPRRGRPTALVHVEAGFWSFALALMAAGVRIPEDVSLLALNETSSLQSWLALGREYPGRQSTWQKEIDPLDERWAPARSLVVSGLSLPFRQMGEWAVHEAVRRMAEPEADPQHRLFNAPFVAGNTVAPPG